MCARFVTRPVKLETTRFNSIYPGAGTPSAIRAFLVAENPTDVLRAISFAAINGCSRILKRTPSAVMILQGVRMMLIIPLVRVPRHRLID